jgi:hypothetical protein
LYSWSWDGVRGLVVVPAGEPKEKIRLVFSIYGRSYGLVVEAAAVVAAVVVACTAAVGTE